MKLMPRWKSWLSRLPVSIYDSKLRTEGEAIMGRLVRVIMVMRLYQRARVLRQAQALQVLQAAQAGELLSRL